MSPFYEKLTFELEFITPAFIGGAFPDEEAELRPASFIGILRWWFRNLALTVTDDIEAIAYLESELFGNQKRAGKVWVKIEPLGWNDINEYRCKKEKTKEILLTTKEEISKNHGEQEIFYPFAYLGYGNILFISFCKNGNPNRQNIKKYFYILKKENCLKPQIKRPVDIKNCQDIEKQPFKIENCEDINIKEKKCYSGNFLVKDFLISHGKPTHKVTILVPRKYKPLLESLLFLVSHLGAIGSRNRRGWGNFILRPQYEIKLPESLEWIEEFDRDLLEKWYKKFVQELQNLGLEKKGNILYLEICQLDFSNTNNKLNTNNKDVFNLLRELARKYRKTRSELKEVSLNQDNRIWLGLPINFGKNKSINLFNQNCKESYRLASPVIFRIVKTTKGYQAILIERGFVDEKIYANNTWNIKNLTPKSKLKKQTRQACKDVKAKKTYQDFINDFKEKMKCKLKKKIKFPLENA
jgi:CRISPR-associated protein Cmr1